MLDFIRFWHAPSWRLALIIASHSSKISEQHKSLIKMNNAHEEVLELVLKHQLKSVVSSFYKSYPQLIFLAKLTTNILHSLSTRKLYNDTELKMMIQNYIIYWMQNYIMTSTSEKGQVEPNWKTLPEGGWVVILRLISFHLWFYGANNVQLWS